jgi:parallel beta-helix repeat protein
MRSLSALLVVLAGALAWAAADAQALTTFWVTTTADSGPGSLRQAILDANATPGFDRIAFNIPGSGVHVIQPLSDLPALTDAGAVNGATQPGYAGTPLIELDGRNQLVVGLELTGGSSVVRALHITGFKDNVMLKSDGNLVSACLIGSRGGVKNSTGVEILGDRNTIGGNSAADRNVIVANAGGVDVTGFRNGVFGDYIGTDPSGTTGEGWGNIVGVYVTNATETRIGGRRGFGNLISGNAAFGVWLQKHGSAAPPTGVVRTAISGNTIGTDVTATNAVPNGVGIRVEEADRTLIGEHSAGQAILGFGNLVSGNAADGIVIADSGRTLVGGNTIGLTGDQTAVLPNGGSGVLLQGGGENRIGEPGEGNTIGGNALDGITMTQGTRCADTFCFGASQSVQANFVGERIDPNNGFLFGVPNGRDGVRISGTLGVAVGGDGPGEANVIAENLANGVNVLSGGSVSILGNHIDVNGLLGIDLAGDGVTPNDALDTDFGPNLLQNYPVITSIEPAGGTSSTVQGILAAAPNTTYHIELFSGYRGCDQSGFGEGDQLDQTFSVTTDAFGFAAFTRTYQPSWQAVTATATDPNGNTSEFSACVPL